MPPYILNFVFLLIVPFGGFLAALAKAGNAGLPKAGKGKVHDVDLLHVPISQQPLKAGHVVQAHGLHASFLAYAGSESRLLVSRGAAA